MHHYARKEKEWGREDLNLGRSNFTRECSPLHYSPFFVDQYLLVEVYINKTQRNILFRNIPVRMTRMPTSTLSYYIVPLCE